jgi:hypothetical protein
LRGAAIDELRAYNAELSAPEVAQLAGVKASDDAAWLDWFMREVDEPCRTALVALQKARAAENEFSTHLTELMVMQEQPGPRRVTPFLTRGDFRQPGDPVEPGTPAALLAFPKDAPRNRLGLAQWLTQPEHPLTSRVQVNRLWAKLFGRGIVGTVDNFGVQGEKPTHPALLDYLAAKFRASGGSIKALIREIVLSRTYQLAAEAQSPRTLADPENRLFSRRSYRRLTAEEIRDSLLFLTGDLKLEQASATALTYGEDLDKPMSFDTESRRSIYLPVARNNLAPELEIFDAANPEMVSGDRPLTTVPTQALYLLNSTSLQKHAATLAQQAYAQPDAITWLHQTILGHAPSPAAAQRANAFITSSPDDREKALADLAHVLLASTEFLFIE